jgi:DNA-binding MarR family transcriptional regulator
METNDLRTLKILEKVDNGFSISQRDIARELNVSVGLVNSFIKRLYTKGYVKATTTPKKHIKYILTPKGIAERSRLTYKYIQYSYQFYKTSLQKLRQLFTDLESQGVRRMVFFGASDLAEIAFLSLQETSIDLVAVVDDRPRGRKMNGQDVSDASQLRTLVYDRVLITDERLRENVLDRIHSQGVDLNKIVFLT